MGESGLARRPRPVGEHEVVAPAVEPAQALVDIREVPGVRAELVERPVGRRPAGRLAQGHPHEVLGAQLRQGAQQSSGVPIEAARVELEVAPVALPERVVAQADHREAGDLRLVATQLRIGDPDHQRRSATHPHPPARFRIADRRPATEQDRVHQDTHTALPCPDGRLRRALLERLARRPVPQAGIVVACRRDTRADGRQHHCDEHASNSHR